MSSPSPAPPRRARVSLAMLALLSALAFMDRQIFAVLLVPVQREFELDDLQVAAVTSLGFALSFAVLAMPLARLSDRGSRRRVIAWCRGLGGALAALGAASGSAAMLAATRMGSAISDAGGGPASMSLAADLMPAGQRSRAMSVFAMASSGGSLLALILGAWGAQHFGWRATLAAIGTSSLLGALALRWVVNEPARAAAGAPAAASLTGAAPGASRGGALAAVLAQPASRWLLIGAALALLAGYSFGIWNFAYLVRRHGLSVQTAGWVTGLSAAGSMVGSGAAGWLADKLVPRDVRWQLGVPVLGLSISLPLALAFLALDATHTGWAIVLLVAFGFFVAWWIAPSYAALSHLVAPERRASANALLLLVGAVGGGGVGPVLTGALSDALAPHVRGDPLGVALALVVLLLLPSAWALWRCLRLYPAALRSQAAAITASQAASATGATTVR